MTKLRGILSLRATICSVAALALVAGSAALYANNAVGPVAGGCTFAVAAVGPVAGGCTFAVAAVGPVAGGCTFVDGTAA